MILVSEIFEAVREISGKSAAVLVTPFNKVAPLASADLFNEYYAKGYPLNQKQSENLRHLVVTSNLTLVSGFATLPTDLVRVDTVSHDLGSIKRVESHVWHKSRTSSVFAPTAEYPIYREIGANIEVLPISGITNPKLTYLKKPTDPVWGFTVVSNRPVYAEGTSTNFEWQPTDKLKLIVKILSYLGISMREHELTNYGETKSSQTQAQQ